MTFEEYNALYNLFHLTELTLNVDGKQRSIQDIFENYPEYELSVYQIAELDAYDRIGLKIALADVYFTPLNVVPYLREWFDGYRSSGGHPMMWLHNTFEYINLNPTYFKAELRTTLEKTLIEWIDIYSKLPFDALYLSENQDISNLKGINSGYSISQLEFIFNKLYQLDYLKENDVDNFVFALQDDYLSTTWSKSIWYGSRKKLYSLFDQMTGLHEPSLMNIYFVHKSKKPFDSNDKPGTKNLIISGILTAAKKIK